MKILIIGSRTMMPTFVFGEKAFTQCPYQFMGKTGYFFKGLVNGKEVIFIARDFFVGDIAPHRLDTNELFRFVDEEKINYIISTCVVGALRRSLKIGDIMLLDQFLDFSRNKFLTSFLENFRFTDITEPFDHFLRGVLAIGLKKHNIPFYDHGCYVCVSGPRFETAAEVKAFRRLGGDVVGMTVVQEAIFAKEKQIPYASIALVANYGAGLTAHVDIKEINKVSAQLMQKIAIVLQEAIGLMEM